MDEFGYLSVLLSIIIGLAVTEVLQGMRRRMLSHVPVRRYWPTQLWSVTLLLVCTQSWWAMFDLRNRHDWEFDQFAVLLAQTVLLYLIAGLVFPEFDGDKFVIPLPRGQNRAQRESDEDKMEGEVHPFRQGVIQDPVAIDAGRRHRDEQAEEAFPLPEVVLA